jgi:hypothetical protein
MVDPDAALYAATLAMPVNIVAAVSNVALDSSLIFLF